LLGAAIVHQRHHPDPKGSQSMHAPTIYLRFIFNLISGKIAEYILKKKPSPSIKMITLKKTSAFIRDKIRQKRKRRRIWQRFRHPVDKKNKLKRATDELKRTLREDKDNRLQYYLSKLGTSLSTN